MLSRDTGRRTAAQINRPADDWAPRNERVPRNHRTPWNNGAPRDHRTPRTTISRETARGRRGIARDRRGARMAGRSPVTRDGARGSHGILHARRRTDARQDCGPG
ncbi:hypothetical protein FRAAL0580 [Frankia alni ACN14a]|uniref:Uncharacterized protein n=1 Tax=Frankia alni (strain DSM 45986 / CECT 9034 / ACN14a) TaxID=326424 RepID=Q0RT49_FRAAA|nr:hypothetical protein FRAAL0580 [Frankia alni ACN14a]